MYFSHIIKAFLIFGLILTANCQKAKRDPVTNKKILKEPNVFKRVEDRAAEGEGLLGKGGVLGNKTTTYDFATSNPLWRASLEVIDFMPLNNVDYSGGVIVTDWYSPKSSKESIKLNINFLSNEISASSVRVKSFVKKCINSECVVSDGSSSLNNKLKDQIINKAREINIEKETKK